jgi:phage N-6-adenine-methyltransferase
MSLVGFKARNHPQQIGVAGALDVVDDRGTTAELFDPIHQRFGFTLDVAAAPHNAKCERYFTLQDDGLTQCWQTPGAVWCNPPYSGLDAWVTKARSEHYGHGLTIVMLLPNNRAEQRWWQDGVEPYRDQPDSPLRIEFLPGRPRFIQSGRSEVGPNERPPFGLCLAIWSVAL